MKNIFKNSINIVLIIIVIVVMIIIVKVFNSYDLNDSHIDEKTSEIDNYYLDNRDKFDLEMGKYVESKDYLLKDGSILVEIDNKNDFAGNGKVYIEFFDDKDESITMQDYYFSYVGAGKKTYVKLIVNEELKKIYKRYRVKVVLTYSFHHEDYEDDIKLISFNDTSETITFKNNTGKKLSLIQWGFLYYDENGSIIDFSTDTFFDIKKNRTIKEKIYLTNDAYSKIEVILLEAYS